MRMVGKPYQVTIGDDVVEQVRRLRSAGMSYERIAAATGISPMSAKRLSNGTQRAADRPRRIIWTNERVVR